MADFCKLTTVEEKYIVSLKYFFLLKEEFSIQLKSEHNVSDQ